jgi:hypothetical protein
VSSQTTSCPSRASPRHRRDLHVALHALVVRHHVADAGLECEAADQAAEPALQHLDDAAFAAAAAVDAGDAGQHAVAMHDLAHLVRRQEQVVAAARVGRRKPKPFGLAITTPGIRSMRSAGAKAAAAVLQQLAVAHHRAQALAQRIEAVGGGQARPSSATRASMAAVFRSNPTSHPPAFRLFSS